MRVMFKTMMVLAFCACASSCNRCSIQGVVVDIQGTTVPGVAVTVADGEAEDLTDALGRYQLRLSPAIHEIHFAKTGYTSGALEIDLSGGQNVSAHTVTLWRLPQDMGVYLLENLEFRALPAVEPRDFVTLDNGFLFGFVPLTDIEKTPLPKPVLMFHRMPSYDIALCRLGLAQVQSAESPGAEKTVMTSLENIPVQAIPIDEPERLLWEVRIHQPLEPAVYAVHWGAFNGQKKTEARAFVFEVVDPNRPVENKAEQKSDSIEKEQSRKEQKPILGTGATDTTQDDGPGGQANDGF